MMRFFSRLWIILMISLKPLHQKTIRTHKPSPIFPALTLVSRCFRWSLREGPTTTLNCTRAFNPLSNTSSSTWTWGGLGGSWYTDREEKGKSKDGQGERVSRWRKSEHSILENDQPNPQTSKGTNRLTSFSSQGVISYTNTNKFLLIVNFSGSSTICKC